MSINRLDQLLNFLEDDPNDPFTIYALALEYGKSDTQKSLALFNDLLEKHPGYIPTYYHAGKTLEKTGHKNQAELVYKKGMEESKKAGNNHAFKELQGALNQLLDDEE